MKDTCTATLVQLTYSDDKGPDTVIERMPAFFEQAAEDGSDIIVFPEYVLGSHITVEHPRVKKFFELAAKHGMYAIAGMVETNGDRWSTTALLADRKGGLVGRYYKTHPASGPGPHWWPPIKDWDGEARGYLGHRFEVFHTDFARIGILECYDGYFPEAWGCISYSGAEIVFWINGRDGMVEDAFCITAASCYGCVVGGNITNGRNTGFAAPQSLECVRGEGQPETSRLFPRIAEPGDGAVTARIDLAKLRWHRKHLRQMHQRRPDLYGILTRDVRMWMDYPDIPWDMPECAEFANKSQL